MVFNVMGITSGRIKHHYNPNWVLNYSFFKIPSVPDDIEIKSNNHVICQILGYVKNTMDKGTRESERLDSGVMQFY